MPSLMTRDYEYLAAGEVKRAALCHTDGCRARHLGRAAVYSRYAGAAKFGSARPDAVLNLIGTLSAILDETDSLALTMTGIHINQAIVELGGIGDDPPEDRS